MSVCQRGSATQSVPDLPCPMGKEIGVKASGTLGIMRRRVVVAAWSSRAEQCRQSGGVPRAITPAMPLDLHFIYKIGNLFGKFQFYPFLPSSCQRLLVFSWRYNRGNGGYASHRSRHEPAPPGEDTVQNPCENPSIHLHLQNPSIHLQLQKTILTSFISGMSITASQQGTSRL